MRRETLDQIWHDRALAVFTVRTNFVDRGGVRRTRWPRTWSDMRETAIFIELVGASGASYRFRAWPETDQSAMAGNFIVAELGPGGIKVHLIGVTNDLSKSNLHAREAGLSDKPLFVRLNVARLTRQQEHDDIVAQYGQAKVFATGA